MDTNCPAGGGAEAYHLLMIIGRAVKVFAVAALLLASTAHAQRHERERGHERERFRTDHWVYDHRFRHDHYYPAIGYRIRALPPGHLEVRFRGEPFWFHSGVWYHRVGPSFVVFRPPFGVIVPVLPPAYTTVYVGPVPYYYANDVYYVQRPDGYEVVAPPPSAPPAAAPQPPAGSWYYCESSKTYYPYVNQCPEGWKTVPATPPAPR
jgi:hypothetical protein